MGALVVRGTKYGVYTCLCKKEPTC